MKNLILFAILTLAVLAVIVFSPVKNNDLEPFVSASEAESNGQQRRTLRAFRSQQELESYLRELAAQQRAQRRSKTTSADTMTANSAAPTAQASESKDKSDDESVTNVQHAGVDEGGIVKLHGEHLVILRRGRLFTVAIGDNALKPISAVDAFAPDINPSGTWYDEMLVSGDTVVVIGYSYQRGGTEVGLFDINDAGNLRYRSTYHLRSNDYYSSRNYASRLIGNKLIFYTPMYLWLDAERPMKDFPAVRKWHKGATENEFQSIVAPTNVYKPAQPISPNYGMALHTVTVCDLASREFKCEATAVIGPAGRVFYVSPKSVYVWVTDWSRGNSEDYEKRSMLYQMPLDGSAPSALRVSGSPVDQFSFLESADNHLNVLVRSEAAGDGMWRAEVAAGDVALLRVSLNSFNDGNFTAPASSYHELPKPEGYTFQNRYVGDYVLYGTGSGWGYAEQKHSGNLYAVRWATGDINRLELEHGVDRIEAIGKDAVIVGTDGKDLHFSPVRLGANPRLRPRYTRPNASQGELRSHGFFYKPDGADSGLLGLPIRESSRPGYEHLYRDSASILFLRNDSLNFKELGELESKATGQLNDNCRASCVDWYGNARPLFVRGRVFALLGYEIVEGNLTGAGIRETRRINYAPSSSKNTRQIEE